MSTLKERLANAPDILEKKIKVLNGSIEVTIRRLTVSERDEILKDRVADSEITPKSSSDQSCRIVAAGMADPKTTFDELQQAPAAFVDEVAGQIMDFNGWTAQGKAALDDTFRPSAGSPIQVLSGGEVGKDGGGNKAD